MSAERAVRRWPTVGADPLPERRFCGHCGARPPASAAGLRVCVRCGLGVILAADFPVAPAAGEPFLVVDDTLGICAVSRSAERLLHVAEPEAVHRRVSDFLRTAAGGAVEDEEALERSALAVAHGSARRRTVAAALAARPEVRCTARIGVCGPPRAVLVVLSAVDDPGKRR